MPKKEGVEQRMKMNLMIDEMIEEALEDKTLRVKVKSQVNNSFQKELERKVKERLTLALGWGETKYPMSKDKARVIGVFIILVFFLSLYLLVVTWPESIIYPFEQGDESSDGENNSSSLGNQVEQVDYFGGRISVSLSAGQRVILVCAFAGALGAVTHMAKSFSFFAGLGELDGRFFYWYLLRPVVGTSLAVILFFVVKAGLFSSEVQPEDINLFGLTALSSIAGIYSQQALGKLKKVANVLLDEDEDKKRIDEKNKEEKQTDGKKDAVSDEEEKEAETNSRSRERNDNQDHR